MGDEVVGLHVGLDRQEVVVDAHLGDAHHDHREPEAGEDLVVVEVAHGPAGQVLVARDGRVVARKARESSDAERLTEMAVEEDPPREILFGISERHHLPVEHRDALENRERSDC